MYPRVDRRHAPALCGSHRIIAAVTIGIVGFAALGNGSDPALQRAAAPGDQAVVSTWADTNVYGCTSYLVKDLGVYGQREMYGDCVVVTWMDNNVEAIPECIVPLTIPTTTIPTTTIPMTTITTTTVVGNVGNVIVEAGTCVGHTIGIVAPCFPVTTTTTSIAIVGTYPDQPGEAVACQTYSSETSTSTTTTIP